MYLCICDSPNVKQEYMTSLQERLFAMQDNQYSAFRAKLTPDVWTHNKTIQKAIKNYRITSKQKEYLHTLKVK